MGISRYRIKPNLHIRVNREEDRSDGKTKSRNGPEWGLEIPRGQRNTEKSGNVLLQGHLQFPDDRQCLRTEIR